MVKGKYLVLLLIILLIVIGGTRFLSATKEKHDLESNVEEYLQEQGYEAEDIKDTAIVNIGQQAKEYAVLVTFADEMGVDYMYGYQDGEIRQIDVMDKNNDATLKHLENKS